MSENKTEENQQEEEVKLTPEQYEKKRKDGMEHLKGEIEFLKVEKEYENLVADVEEARTKGVMHIAQRAQFFARQNVAQQQADGTLPPDTPPGEEPPATPPPAATPPAKPRKLATD